MSDGAVADIEALNLREQIVRIDRLREQGLKFAVEQRKLTAEMLKLGAEQNKLAAEATKLSAEGAKFRRERILAPVLAAAALGGFIAALVPTILRSWGVP